VDEKEAVAEVDGDQASAGTSGRPKRSTVEQRPRELEPGAAPVDGEQCEIDEQRADSSDDDAERALLPDDDEAESGADRDAMLAGSRTNAVERLGAEEGGRAKVVHSGL
jgi:hypothetical protein